MNALPDNESQPQGETSQPQARRAALLARRKVVSTSLLVATFLGVLVWMEWKTLFASSQAPSTLSLVAMHFGVLGVFLLMWILRDSLLLGYFARRKWMNRVALTLSLVAMVFGVFWLMWILWETLKLGFGGLSLTLFTQNTPPPNDAGGLANALFGSFLMVTAATLIGAPIGVLSGIYLAEYRPHSALAVTVRFVNDLLLSAPSIVIGLFVYAVIVVRFRQFSGWAGAVALALIVIPVVIRTTENMLALIPASLREAAYALGAPKWKVIIHVTLNAARAGVITGILLAVARISGETAPLLFTALNNQFWTSDLSGPTANLPVTIFQFAMSPYENWQQLAWVGVFLITLAVLGLNILARLLSRHK